MTHITKQNIIYDIKLGNYKEGRDMFIIGMLKEELENSLRAREGYRVAAEKLPKGSLVRKEISGHPYYYLAYRDGKKVRFKYVGKLSKKEANRYKEAGKYRARYRKQISELNKQIKFIRKAIRGHESI